MSQRLAMLIVGGFTLIVAVAVAVGIYNMVADRNEAPQASPAPTVPAEDGAGANVGDEAAPRTAAKPTNDAWKPAGCATATKDEIGELLATLKARNSTVELSSAWDGPDNKHAVALMVRSAEGTIDQPHLVWFKDGDDWVAASPDTAKASTTKSDINLYDQSAGPVDCLLADSR